MPKIATLRLHSTVTISFSALVATRGARVHRTNWPVQGARPARLQAPGSYSGSSPCRREVLMQVNARSSKRDPP